MTNFKAMTDRELLNPQTILRDAGIGYGSRVAELGCGGMGHFVFEAAKLVGDKGQVYAVDVLKTALKSIETRASLQGLTNVKTVWSNLEILGATNIPEASLDFTLLINTLFQSKKLQAMIRESVRLLKIKGCLLVIEWKTTGAPFGPRKEDRIPQELLETVASELHLTKQRSFDPGPYHYGLTFVKNP